MPEVHFRVRWPDRSLMHAYSPSSTIKDAFVLGHPYPVEEFVRRSRAALEHASQRVAQIYGYGCGHAAAQIREIEWTASRFDEAAQRVVVEAFED
ncbi:MAG: MSMEG_0570 family nitrogen starvation response protein [Panacagrimonas sp.]